MIDWTLHRILPPLVRARRVSAPETVTVGPPGYLREQQAQPGDWVVEVGGGLMVATDEAFRSGYEVEVHPEDQARWDEAHPRQPRPLPQPQP